MSSNVLPAVLLGLLLSGSVANAALIFNISWDPTIDADFGTDAPALKSAFQYATQEYSNLYSDPIHLNITVKARSGTFLGLSGPHVPENANANDRPPGWLKNQAALIADAKSRDDFTAIGPNGSASGLVPPPTANLQWTATTAQEKALGLIPDDAVTQDGDIFFSPNHTWTYDPNHRVVTGAFDFIGTAEHEISEIMGRVGLSGSGGFYTVLDMFSYAGPGTRRINAGAGENFSIDAGTTLLKTFNNGNIGGDSRDWATATNDSFNAVSNPGVMNGISAVDIRALDVIGYDLIAPEPSMAALMGIGLLALTGFARRLRR